MLIGAFYFPTDYGIAIDELARELEARGFESLFVCEHTHIPVSRRTPFAGGGELPKRYWHTHDPFVALSFAAAATRTLKLGTGIALIPQRDPIITAKAVASLDQLSGGRFIFAIGGGWNVEEMENHGARYETRFKLLRERVLAMKALWTQEQAEFHGQFVNFDPVWLYPSRRTVCSRSPAREIAGCGAWSSSATAGSRARAVAGSPRPRRRGCAKRPSRRDAIPRRSRSRCSTPRPIGRRLRPIARRGSRACCSKCPTWAATRSCAGSIRARRSRRTIGDRVKMPVAGLFGF